MIKYHSWAGKYCSLFLFKNLHFDSNYWQKSLDTTSLESTNQNSINIPKVFESTNKMVIQLWVPV